MQTESDTYDPTQQSGFGQKAVMTSLIIKVMECRLSSLCMAMGMPPGTAKTPSRPSRTCAGTSHIPTPASIVWVLGTTGGEIEPARILPACHRDFCR